MSLVKENLYLGSYNEFPKDKNISLVINVTTTIKNVSDCFTIRIPIEDTLFHNIKKYFNVIDTINDALKSNKSIFVHCRCGISRSPTIIIAYLMKYDKMNLK